MLEDAGEQLPGPGNVAGSLVEVGQRVPKAEVVRFGPPDVERGPLQEFGRKWSATTLQGPNSSSAQGAMVTVARRS